MYAVERAHFTAPYAIRYLLRPTILSYYNLVFFRHRAPTASSANTPPSLVRARSSSTRFTGPSSVSLTTSSANATTSPSCDRSAAAHPSTTTSRVLSDFSSDLTSFGSKINLRRVYRTISSTDRGVCNTTRQGYLQPGYYRVVYPFVLLSLPLTMVPEFLLEFLHGSCFVRIGFLIVSFGFDLFFLFSRFQGASSLP